LKRPSTGKPEALKLKPLHTDFAKGKYLVELGKFPTSPT
jgi:hypothetical protein